MPDPTPDRSPILFVHGLYDTHADGPAMLGARPLLFPELLGYGPRAHVAPDRITMESQADFVADQIRALDRGPAHVIGQSVGGVIAFLAAARHPDRVASVVSVEGNFTLDDAFWSSKVAALSPAGAAELLEGQRRDPAAWLRGSGIEPDDDALAVAHRALSVSPGTLQAMARSVITATTNGSFTARVEELMDRGLRVRLLAGERSRSGWNVPESVVRRAGGVHVMPGAGHLMMLEQPREFLRWIDRLTAAA